MIQATGPPITVTILIEIRQITVEVLEPQRFSRSKATLEIGAPAHGLATLNRREISKNRIPALDKRWRLQP